MVTGVSQGFVRRLQIEGVGYRAELQGQNLVLNVGYSHPVIIEPPDGISVEVEKGYGRSLYDYINDLSTREILHQICNRAPESVKRKVHKALNALDNNFIESTDKAFKPFNKNAIEIHQPWWFRIPKHLHPELESNLISEGFLSN